MTLNEANTRKQLIDRALESVGWKESNPIQIRGAVGLLKAVKVLFT